MTLSFLWLCRLSSLLGAEGLNPRWVGTPSTAVCVDLNHTSAHLCSLSAAECLTLCLSLLSADSITSAPENQQRCGAASPQHLQSGRGKRKSTSSSWSRFHGEVGKGDSRVGKAGSPETPECEIFD